MDSTATFTLATIRATPRSQQKCPKGHVTEYITVAYHADGAAVASRRYCPICWVDWMGDMFPAEPMEVSR